MRFAYNEQQTLRGIDLTVQQAVRLLKGDKGTKVTITIERPGSDSPFGVTIERDEIPIQSLRVSYIVEPGVGVGVIYVGPTGDVRYLSKP